MMPEKPLSEAAKAHVNLRFKVQDFHHQPRAIRKPEPLTRRATDAPAVIAVVPIDGRRRLSRMIVVLAGPY